MRKEIKRALLVWPLLASSTVCSLATIARLDLAGRSGSIGTHRPVDRARDAFLDAAKDLSIAAVVRLSGATWAEHLAGVGRFCGVGSVDAAASIMPLGMSDAFVGDAKCMERTSGGAAGLRVPPRLAKIFGVRSEAAPLINDTLELAGRNNAGVGPHHEVTGPLSPIVTVDTRRDDLLVYRWLQSDVAAQGVDSFTRLLISLGDVPASTPRLQAAQADASPSALPASISALGKYQRVTPAQPLPSLEPADASESAAELAAGQSMADALSRRVRDAADAAESDDDAAGATRPAITRRIENTAGWPTPTSLHDQLDRLIAIASDDTTPHTLAAIAWAGNVDQRLGRLQSLNWLGDPAAGDLLQDLQSHAAAGIEAAEAAVDRDLQIQWLRVSHSLARRLAVWGPVWKVVHAGHRQSIDGSSPTFSTMASDYQQTLGADRIARYAAALQDELNQTGDASGWNTFLLLDEIRQAADRPDRGARVLVSQRFLSRLQWYALTAEHHDWLKRDSVQRLAAAISHWTATPIDYANLVRELERQEANSIDLAGISIADSVQSLRFSHSEPSVAVADAINTHYRNANVRFAVSDTLLRRMLPDVSPQVKPVRTRLLGSRIIGTSKIDSDLDLRLVPSADSWSLQLRTLGNVATRSVGLNGPVQVSTSGRSLFESTTPIRLSTNKITIGDSVVNVNNQNRLHGISSKYDGLPLLGALVRSIAASEYEDTKPISNRFASQQIQQSVRTEVDATVREKLDTATQSLTDVVLGPLGRLHLEPMVVDMRTTDSRLMARYRLAGDWQMAAFTPRPRAPQDSLLSVQVHQSSINNLLEQLVPRGKPASVHELVKSGLMKFDTPDAAIPADLPDDVMIQFADTRPITVEIEEDRLWLTIRIVELSKGDQLSLSKFIVRACYRPSVDGNQAMLVRDGGLRISGPRMSIRERLPVRAIFNQILDEERPLPLTLPAIAQHPALASTAITQLELRDGWLAIAMADTPAADRVAGRREVIGMGKR